METNEKLDALNNSMDSLINSLAAFRTSQTEFESSVMRRFKEIEDSMEGFDASGYGSSFVKLKK